MSDENNSPPDTSNRARRGSFTSNTFTALFGRSNSTSGPSPTVAPQPGPVNAPAAPPNRRMSIAAIGLSGTSPIQTSNFGFPGGRRGSVSTAGSDSIDENAVDDDEGPSRSQPTTPFTRRMSFGAQALFNARSNGSPTSGRTPSHPTHSSPLSRANGEAEHGKKSPSTQASTKSQPRTKSDYSSTGSAEGLNWSEQFRSRAESAVQRPSFGANAMPKTPTSPSHNRAKSFSDMPSPPTASIPAPAPAPQQSALRRKPDAVGERILRGDFYMD